MWAMGNCMMCTACMAGCVEHKLCYQVSSWPWACCVESPGKDPLKYSSSSSSSMPFRDSLLHYCIE